MTINEKLYKIRTDLGLSQKEFADKVGTSQSAINYWENGKRQPRMAQIKKIASAFKLPLYALTDDDFEIWDLSNELENNKARFINPTNPTKRLGRFTAPSNNDRHKIDIQQTVKILNENHFNHLLQKEDAGEELTQEEKEYKEAFLEEAFKELTNKFAEYYFKLNKEGQKKADKEIKRTLEFLMLISQVPEYQSGADDKK